MAAHCDQDLYCSMYHNSSQISQTGSSKGPFLCHVINFAGPLPTINKIFLTQKLIVRVKFLHTEPLLTPQFCIFFFCRMGRDVRASHHLKTSWTTMTRTGLVLEHSDTSTRSWKHKHHIFKSLFLFVWPDSTFQKDQDARLQQKAVNVWRVLTRWGLIPYC